MTDKAPTVEEIAWALYCEETSGDMDVRDYWEQLPKRVQDIYLHKANVMKALNT